MFHWRAHGKTEMEQEQGHVYILNHRPESQEVVEMDLRYLAAMLCG